MTLKVCFRSVSREIHYRQLCFSSQVYLCNNIKFLAPKKKKSKINWAVKEFKLRFLTRRHYSTVQTCHCLGLRDTWGKAFGDCQRCILEKHWFITGTKLPLWEMVFTMVFTMSVSKARGAVLELPFQMWGPACDGD